MFIIPPSVEDSGRSAGSREVSDVSLTPQTEWDNAIHRGASRAIDVIACYDCLADW
jgi:hypothetical protein